MNSPHAPPDWTLHRLAGTWTASRPRVSPTFVSCHFLQASPIFEMSFFKLFEIHFIRFNKNSSVQDSDFGLGQRNVSSFYPHLSCCVHKTGPMLLNVELTVPLTNETRHLFWIWCHGYPQACIPGEGASPRTVLRWQYWFNLLIRSLGLTVRKTQPKLLNYLSHAALLTLYSSTDGNSSTDISSGWRF